MPPLTYNSAPLLILPLAIDVPHFTSVERNTTFNYFGPVSSPLVSRAAHFLCSNTDTADEASLDTTLQSFLHASHADCVGNADEKSCCWFTIRLTKPHSGFDVPRWHQDGRMYTYDEGREAVARSKYALTLLGPPTLVLPAEDAVFATMAPGEEKQDQVYGDLRMWLAQRFQDVKRVEVGKGQVVRFGWGREDSPVHSEPRLETDRVFMTVLFGSERELRSMCEIRGVNFGKFDGM
ncbi:hypothetical protein P171DRAFT_430087 [Karstenula rhodostoma CBS 690.94]|uniref:Uncharacterized protein n=1 Tax=Karstenula rhodostoma CBS 690.94 TaxID=1392251 RepID=A0A9P4PN87_9PLEO|nr:hypothetical protein P171DRAFT_430087 [Karstenula rhodostoma CBS 690.94]